MKLSLRNLLSALVGLPQARAATRRNRKVRLNFDKLEERATPSALSPYHSFSPTLGAAQVHISGDQYSMH